MIEGTICSAPRSTTRCATRAYATYRRYFGKFAKRYGFKDAFEGSTYRWPTAEARWGYLATLLDTTLNAPPRKPYRDLDAILAKKDFFVLTTNQDTKFVKLYPWRWQKFKAITASSSVPVAAPTRCGTPSSRSPV